MVDNSHLNEEQRKVLLEGGTEPPYTGKYLDHNERGDYICANCGNLLFASKSKYESNLPGLRGWPSFSDVAKSKAIELSKDDSLGMNRTEAKCANCKGHLGHLFDDTSSPSGKHYCINSVSLDFKPADDKQNQQRRK
jgi:methionine-R-sulfoxide reductase